MTQTILPAGVQVFGEPQLHTDGDVLALTFAPDGSLWSVEEPDVLRHWNAETGKQLEWQALSDLEIVWTFSRDGRYLASASDDDLTVWDISSGQVITSFKQDAWVSALAFGPDSSTLVTGHDDGTIRTWDLDIHHLTHEFRQHTRPISALAFSRDGNLLAAAAEDKVISLWDMNSALLRGTLTGHTDRIPALVFHPSGEYLVSAGWDTNARVWNIRNQESVFLFNNHSGQVTALAFNDDGSRLVSADAGLAVHIWDFTTRKELYVLKESQSEIRCLTFSRDGKKLAACGERMIHLWDAQSGKPVAGSGPRPVAKTTLAISPNGKQLASNRGGSAPQVWECASKKTLFSLEEKEILHGLAFDPKGNLLAGAAGSHIRLWNAATGKLVRDIADPVLKEPATNLAFSPDALTLANGSATGQDVWLWRIADGEPILYIPNALDGCTIESLAFHPEGRYLAVGGIDFMATGGSNGAISIWDVQEHAEIATFLDGTTCVVFHPSGKRLASTSLDQSICIWDIESGEIQAELTGHDGPIACVAYSPDGQWLASGGEDRTVRLWDDEGTERALVEVDSQISGLTFSPDGQYLYTANANTTCSQIKIKDMLNATGG